MNTLPLRAFLPTTLWLVLASSSFAVDRTWIGGSSNQWNNANAWDPVGTPDNSDTAIFNTSGETTVSLAASASVGLVHIFAGEVTFAFGASTLTGKGLWRMDGNSATSLTLQSGTIAGGADLHLYLGVNTGNNGNLFNLEGGDVTLNSLRVGSTSNDNIMRVTGGSLTASTLHVGASSGSSGNLFAISGNGATLNLAGGSLQVGTSSASTSNNRFTVSDGAVVTTSNSQFFIRYGNSNAFVLEGTGSSFTQNVTGEGDLRVGDAGVNSSLSVLGGTFASNAKAQIYAGSSNKISIQGGSASFTGSSLTNQEMLEQTGGTLTINHLTSTAGGKYLFNAGRMELGSALFSHTATFNVGNDDSQTATLHLRGGTYSGTGALAIRSDGELTGSGQVTSSGGVTIEGTLAPGEGLATGSLTFVSLLLGADAAVALKLGASGSDHVATTGLLTFNGKINLSLSGSFEPEAGTSFDLFDWGSADFSNFNLSDDLLLPTLDPHLVWDTSRFLDEGRLTVVAVPEPGAVALLGIAGCFGMFSLRRRR